MRDSDLSRPTRREAIGRLGVGAALGLAAAWRGSVEALAQAGWQAARTATVAFPKGAIVRTLLKDISPDLLSGGATQIHEHVGSRFTPAPPLGASDLPPGPVAPRNEAEFVDLMVE